MAEERWHDFAKEKPSEYMEGRNFIVSNGHYEKIATWCGYWENEPFMGDRLCDEVVRWKFYLTPEEEKANEATRTELKAYYVVASSETENYINGETNLAFEAYDADEVDALLAKKDKEIESLKASHYAEMVDAGMRERKLKRALWLARAERANEIHFMWCQLIYDKKYGIVKFSVKKRWWAEDLKQGQTLHTPQGWADVWDEVERKCLKKAEEYK